MPWSSIACARLLAQGAPDDGAVDAELVLARDAARRQGAPLLEERASRALEQVAPAATSGEPTG
jgi:hypothetical protein